MVRGAGVVAVVAGMALAGLSGGCGRPAPAGAGDGRISVVAAFYPLQFVAEGVGGDAVRVTNLTRAGAEPHDLELQPSQLGAIEDAKLVVYLAGFQPAVDEAVRAQGRQGTPGAFDAAAVQPLRPAPTSVNGDAEGEDGGDGGEADPHVWLDPVRLATIAAGLADRLGAVAPERAGELRARADRLGDELRGLDQEYAAGLARCARRDVVTSHAAFGYLAARYHLDQVPIAGVSPEEEPSPQRVAQIARLARERGVTTIFFESLVSPKLARTVADEIGAQAAVLDPIEGVEGADTYFTVMRANLVALRSALGCG